MPSIFRLSFVVVLLLSASVHVAFGQGETPNTAGLYWKLKGNANTNSGTNFLGTTDNVSLRVRTNNLQRAVIDSTGNMGIGTTTPAERLHVSGNARVSSLAGAGSRMMLADANGTLTAVAAGTTGQVLTQTAGGPAWQAASDWGVTGNTGTNPATNYVGTTDAQALVFRTTATERARISAGGYFVVNSAAPFAGDVFSAYAGGSDYAVNGYGTGSGAGGYFLNNATGDAIVGAQTGTAGSAAYLVTSGASANATSTLEIYNQTGSAPAIFVTTDLAIGSADGLEMNINGAAGKRGIDMYMGTGGTGIGMTIFHNGNNRCINLQQQSATNTQPAIYASASGAARVINATNALTTNTQQVGFYNQGSTGLDVATYGNAAATWGQSAGIRGAVFVAGGASTNTTCLQATYTGAAGNYDGVGIYGRFTSNPLYGYGVLGEGSWFAVYAIGDIGATGVKPFQIDHPLDPANKYLKHFSIESNEVLNFYRGTVTLDANGEATVTMPDYFHAININFSYNLTPVGAAANLYIAQEIDAQGNFRIAGGQQGQKVCWNVYGDRNDAYVQQNPEKALAEVQKKPHDVGLYLTPQLYGQPEEKGIFFRYRADPSKVAKAEEAKPEQSKPTHSRQLKNPSTAPKDGPTGIGM